MMLLFFFSQPFGCSIALFSSFFLCKTSRIIIFDFFSHLPHLLLPSAPSAAPKKKTNSHMYIQLDWRLF